MRILVVDDEPERRVAVLRERDVVPLEPERPLERGAQRRFVVDDQNAHPRSLTGPPEKLLKARVTPP